MDLFVDYKEKERKGSTCKTLRPLPVFVKCESTLEEQDREYFRKADLSDIEHQHNEKVFDETMAIMFPEERMKDKFYRDKDLETAIKFWIHSVCSPFDKTNSPCLRN